MDFTHTSRILAPAPDDQAGLAAMTRHYVSQYWRSQPLVRRRGFTDPAREATATDASAAEPATSQVSVSEVADALGVDPRRLARAFVATQGMKLADFLKLERMRHAQRLLLQTSLTVAEIAYACGYASGANFATAFRTHSGRTPQQFRSDPPDEALQESRGLVRWP